MKGTGRGANVFGEFPKLRLDVQSLGLDDERMNEIATIIAEEAEAERELTRAEVPDSGPEAGGNKPMGLLGGSYSYANSLRWDLLLTFGDCALRCAARASMDVVDLVTFARTHCQPSDQWLLFWYETALKVLLKGVKTEREAAAVSRALAEAAQAESKLERIRAGASTGGKKSAETRRQNQSTPGSDELLAERQKLIDGGMEARNVAAFQAKKYAVTPAAIRAAYKRN